MWGVRPRANRMSKQRVKQLALAIHHLAPFPPEFRARAAISRPVCLGLRARPGAYVPSAGFPQFNMHLHEQLHLTGKGGA